MDYDTGTTTHLWTDYHTLQFKCVVNVPKLIKERLEELLRERGSGSDVHVNEIYDREHAYKRRGTIYIEKESDFNLLTAHTSEGVSLKQFELVEEEVDPNEPNRNLDWGAGEYKVKLVPLIIQPSDLVVSVPESKLPEDFKGEIENGNADVTFTLLGLTKMDPPEGTMTNVLYAEIPDGVEFDEIEDHLAPLISFREIIPAGGMSYVDYPFILQDEWTIRNTKKTVFVIEFLPDDPAARFLMFMIKGIWFYDDEEPDDPILVSFWNKKCPTAERSGGRGGRGGRGSSPGRGGRGGSSPGRGGRGGSSPGMGGRGGSSPGRGGRGGSSPGRGGRGGRYNKKAEIDGDGFQTARRK